MLAQSVTVEIFSKASDLLGLAQQVIHVAHDDATLYHVLEKRPKQVTILDEGTFHLRCSCQPYDMLRADVCEHAVAVADHLHRLKDYLCEASRQWSQSKNTTWDLLASCFETCHVNIIQRQMTYRIYYTYFQTNVSIHH